MEHIFLLAALLVVLFWIVGTITGIVSMIFFLELEEEYLFAPAKHWYAEAKVYVLAHTVKVVSLVKKVPLFVPLPSFPKPTPYRNARIAQN